MYLDEQDELRPVADHKSGGMSRSTLLGGGVALLVVIVIGLVAALSGGDDEAADVEAVTATPLVAPRSQGQLAPAESPAPAPSLPAPAPSLPAPAPSPVAPAAGHEKPKSPAPLVVAPAPAPVPTPRPEVRHAAAPVEQGPTEDDLLQRLTDRAGAFAARPAAPSEPTQEVAAPSVVAPTPEFSDPPPPPVRVPELSDEPPP